MIRTKELLERTNQTGKGFLLIELSTALTFLSVADTTRNRETMARNRVNARNAYESVLRFRGRVQFADEEKVSFDGKLHEVKQALAAAGLPV